MGSLRKRARTIIIIASMGTDEEAERGLCDTQLDTEAHACGADPRTNRE